MNKEALSEAITFVLKLLSSLIPAWTKKKEIAGDVATLTYNTIYETYLGDASLQILKHDETSRSKMIRELPTD
jgi:hypothetical protein